MRRKIPALEAAAPGVALVVTLMMMSVMTMMVVGLAGVMRNEQTAVRSLTYQVLAEQLAEVGAQQGITAVLTSTPAAGQMTATGPGWMLAGNATRYLFSPAGSPQDVKNLERIGIQSLILGLPTGVRGSVYAGWTNLSLPGQPTNRPIGRLSWWVDDEGTKLNLNAVGSNNTNLFLPYLTRGITGSANTNESPTFPFSADWVFVDPSTGQTNAGQAAQAQALRSRIQWLPTPESLKGWNFLNFPRSSTNLLTENQYHQIKGHVTTWSSNSELTPWGTPKLNLSDPAVTVAQIKGALTANAWTNFFGTNLSLSRKYGDLLLDQIAVNIKGVSGNPPNIGYEVGYGNLDYNRHRQNLPTTAISQHTGPFLNQARLLVDQVRTPNTATLRLHLGVQIFNPNQLDMSGYRVEVRPRKFRFQVLIDQASLGANPAIQPSQNNIYYRNMVAPTVTAPIPLTQANLYIRDADWMNLPGGNPDNNWKPTSYWIGPEWNETGGDTPNGDLGPFPQNPPISSLLAGSNSFPETILSQTIGVSFANGMLVQSVGNTAYVMLDQVILRRNSDNRVMDWLSFDDFSQQGNYRENNNPKSDNGQISVSILPRGPNNPVWTDFGTDGLWKTDPQTRFPNSMWDSVSRGSFTTNGLPAGFSARAWKRVTETFDCTSINGTVTGVSYLWPDPVTNGTVFNSHPYFVQGYLPTNGIRSVAQLGAIHTGIPWRTLRFQATPAAELAQGPPDWILLDAFTATNPAVALPRVNLNGLITSLSSPTSTNPGVPLDSASRPQTRPWPVLGAMGSLRGSLSATNTNAYASNGIPFSLTNTNAAFSNSRLLALSASLSGVLTNPASGGTNWAANSGWGNQRVSLANRFPSNGLALTGELLEVRGVADDGAIVGEDVTEGRLRGFLDMVTTRSDTFSVWSIGQALVVVTNTAGIPIRTNVMGEVRKQTVFQREPIINGGAVSGYRLKTLYTRNHIVE